MEPTHKPAESPFSKRFQREQKRQAILSEAARLFNIHGARATRLSDVAEHLDLNQASLYYYVKSKDDLIFQTYMASCASIEEMLDDEHQPRVDINQLLAAASGEDPLPQDDRGPDEGAEDSDEEYEDDDEEYEDDDEEPAGEGGIFEGVAGSEDPADRLLFNLFSAAVTKGRDMSSKPRKPRSRRRRRRTKTSKSKSR